MFLFVDGYPCSLLRKEGELFSYFLWDYCWKNKKFIEWNIFFWILKLATYTFTCELSFFDLINLATYTFTCVCIFINEPHYDKTGANRKLSLSPIDRHQSYRKRNYVKNVTFVWRKVVHKLMVVVDCVDHIINCIIRLTV